MEVAAHIRVAMYPSLQSVQDYPLWFNGFSFATRCAHHATRVFFVISDWLAGAACSTRLGGPARSPAMQPAMFRACGRSGAPDRIVRARDTATRRGEEDSTTERRGIVRRLMAVPCLQTVMTHAFDGNVPQ